MSENWPILKMRFFRQNGKAIVRQNEWKMAYSENARIFRQNGKAIVRQNEGKLAHSENAIFSSKW